MDEQILRAIKQSSEITLKIMKCEKDESFLVDLEDKGIIELTRTK